MKRHRGIKLVNGGLPAVLLYILFFGLISLYIITSSISNPLSHDEHQFVASGAVLVNNGWLPYADYPFFHAPLLALIYGALFASNWPLLLSARIFSCVCMLGTLIAVFYGIQKAFHPREVPYKRLVALIIVLTLLTCMVVRFSMGYAWNHDLPVLTFIIAFLILAFNLQKIEPWKAFLVGFLLAISWCVRLSFAPLVLPFFAFLLYSAHKSSGKILKNVLGFSAGIIASSLPFIYFILWYPQQTLFGNLIYPALNKSWYAAKGSDRAFSLWDKVKYIINDVNYLPFDANILGEYGINRIFFMLGICAIITGVIVIWKGGYLKMHFAFWLACLPFTLLGSFAATPPQLQYFYPLFIWFALGIGWMAAYWMGVIIGTPKQKIVIKYIGVAAVGVVILFTGRIVSLIPDMNFKECDACKILTQANILKNTITKGRVLTLAPIIPLEAGLDIIPGFVTGPFAWRVSGHMPEKTRAQMRVMSTNHMIQLFKDNQPEIILTGYEDARLEKMFFEYAKELGYYSMPLPTITGRKTMMYLSPTILSSGS